MKFKSSNFLNLLWGILMICSCQDPVVNLPSEKKTKLSKKTVVEQAQEYNEKKGDSFYSIFSKKQTGISRSQQTLKPDWKHATVKETYDRQTIEVPLVCHMVEKVRVKNLLGKKGAEKMLAVDFKLLIHKNKKTGKFYQYVSSVIQLDSLHQKDSLSIDYNENNEIYAIHGIIDGKFRLLRTLEEDDPESHYCEIDIEGESRQFAYRFILGETLSCPICGAEIKSGYCSNHGYLMEDVNIIEHPNYYRVVSTVLKNCCYIFSYAFQCHCSSSDCSGACDLRDTDLKYGLIDRFLSCVGGLSLTYTEILANLCDETIFFTEPTFANPHYYLLNYNDNFIWMHLGSRIESETETIVWNLTMALREYDLFWWMPTDPDPDPDPDEGGGGSEGTPTPPEEEEEGIRPQISVVYLTSELMQDYSIKVEMPANSAGITPNIEQAEFLIRRKGTDQWLSLGMEWNGNPLYHTRVAITPGFFELKAEVSILGGGTVLGSNIVEVEEQYPSIDNFRYVAEAKAIYLWNETVAFATQNQNSHQVREYGSLIYLNTEDGEYSCGAGIPGNTVTLDDEVMATVNFEIGDIMPDPRETGLLVVGAIHSHYPMTWAINNLYRIPGPSSADNDFSLPGLVHDYTKRVSAGDPVNMAQNPKKMYIYGPDRRATPEVKN